MGQEHGGRGGGRHDPKAFAICCPVDATVATLASLPLENAAMAASHADWIAVLLTLAVPTVLSTGTPTRTLEAPGTAHVPVVCPAL